MKKETQTNWKQKQWGEWKKNRKSFGCIKNIQMLSNDKKGSFPTSSEFDTRDLIFNILHLHLQQAKRA